MRRNPRVESLTGSGEMAPTVMGSDGGRGAQRTVDQSLSVKRGQLIRRNRSRRACEKSPGTTPEGTAGKQDAASREALNAQQAGI